MTTMKKHCVKNRTEKEAIKEELIFRFFRNALTNDFNTC